MQQCGAAPCRRRVLELLIKVDCSQLRASVAHIRRCKHAEAPDTFDADDVIIGVLCLSRSACAAGCVLLQVVTVCCC